MVPDFLDLLGLEAQLRESADDTVLVARGEHASEHVETLRQLLVPAEGKMSKKGRWRVGRW